MRRRGWVKGLRYNYRHPDLLSCQAGSIVRCEGLQHALDALHLRISHYDQLLEFPKAVCMIPQLVADVLGALIDASMNVVHALIEGHVLVAND